MFKLTLVNRFNCDMAITLDGDQFIIPRDKTNEPIELTPGRLYIQYVKTNGDLFHRQVKVILEGDKRCVFGDGHILEPM